MVKQHVHAARDQLDCARGDPGSGARPPRPWVRLASPRPSAGARTLGSSTKGSSTNCPPEDNFPQSGSHAHTSGLPHYHNPYTGIHDLTLNSPLKTAKSRLSGASGQLRRNLNVSYGRLVQ